MTIETYMDRKHEAEMRRTGHVEYAKVTLNHVCGGICGGDNLACRSVTKEWRKRPNIKQDKE